MQKKEYPDFRKFNFCFYNKKSQFIIYIIYIIFYKTKCLNNEIEKISDNSF